MGCCPFHDDNNPSFGVSLEEPHLANCFYCGGMTLEKVVAQCKGFYKKGLKGEKYYDYNKAKDWLREKFQVSFNQPSEKFRRVPRYDDGGEGVHRDDSDREQSYPFHFPEYRIATFSSGKTTHEDFFNMGFKKSTGREFGVGFDPQHGRITIPLRWRDGTLAGVVGRSTSDKKFIQKTKEVIIQTPGGKPIRVKRSEILPNPRYYIYWGIDKAEIIFPLWKFEYPDLKKLPKRLRKKFVIICEGPLDAMWLYQCGFTNAISILGSEISDQQLDLILSLGPEFIINMLDNPVIDRAGAKGTKNLVEKAKKKIPIFNVTYPLNKEGIPKKDPRDCTKQELKDMIEKARIYLYRPLTRLK